MAKVRGGFSTLALVCLCLLPLTLCRQIPTATEEDETDPGCPLLDDCIHFGIDVMVTSQQRHQAGAARVADVAACQSFCLATKRTFYRFLPVVGSATGLCHCFDSCTAVVPGKSTVGLASACLGSPSSEVLLPPADVASL